tara:strand:+ start:839 stop:1072 length:234 start_codon:yes stop_codon:yes gene_type:complete
MTSHLRTETFPLRKYFGHTNLSQDGYEAGGRTTLYTIAFLASLKLDNAAGIRPPAAVRSYSYSRIKGGRTTLYTIAF